MQAFALTIWSNYFDIASSALREGCFYTAETMFAAAVSEAENYDLNPLRQAASLHGLACAVRGSGRPLTGDMYLRKAFRLICQSDDINTADLSAIACLLADSYLERQEGKKALPVLKVAVVRITKADGSQSSTLLPLLKRIAQVYWQGGREQKGRTIFEKMTALEKN